MVHVAAAGEVHEARPDREPDRRFRSRLLQPYPVPHRLLGDISGDGMSAFAGKRHDELIDVMSEARPGHAERAHGVTSLDGRVAHQALEYVPARAARGRHRVEVSLRALIEVMTGVYFGSARPSTAAMTIPLKEADSHTVPPVVDA